MYNPQIIEPEILEFWTKHTVHQKAKEKNKECTPFYFLDGPPYTSGKVHIGTAWNKVLKDTVLRYKRMRGFNVWDRAGYDMHGLPIEHNVEAKFGIKGKDEIPQFGVERFIKECEKFALENLELMNKDFIRLGAWLDFENAYTPITQQSIEAIWWLIKEVHKQKRLYAGRRPMTWCPTCATALAKHELEYENLNEMSIYLKFPVKSEEGSFFIIWTTTPWTIPFNQFIMANQNVDYIKAKVGSETWIVAKVLADHLIREVAKKDYTIIAELKGAELEGMEYLHPYADQLPQQLEMKKTAPKMYTIILTADYVDTAAGTGLVHAASGTGIGADYEVAHANKIIPWSEVDDNGYFEGTMGPFAGLRAKFDDRKLITMFEEKNILAGKEQYTHEYPHCWRCHKPAIFRTTTQWFFKVEDLKEQMLAENKAVQWVPQSAFNAFDAWLRNLRDNSITKQRYWGTPLPVWQCLQCDHFEVLATKQEIEQKGRILLKDLHKPWIDEVKYSCEKCHGSMQRIPDVMDVWIDPGCASWICLNFPYDKNLFNKYFPADFILEGNDQFRGWFNVLMVCSMLAFRKPSFKACYVHGMVQDAQGRKMSKSSGNVISPYEVIDKFGADTFRYYVIGGTAPGLDLHYNFDDMKLKHRNLMILWNLHLFLIELAHEAEVNPERLQEPVELSVAEQYMLAKLSSSIKKAGKLFEDYEISQVPWVVEELYLELSRTYIQLVRDKAALGSQQEKNAIIYTMYHSLMSVLKIFAPVAPFITEKIYLNLRNEFRQAEESIHLFSWPKAMERHANLLLEKQMAIVQDILQAVLAAREKIKLGLRWPLKELVIEASGEIKEAVIALEEILLQQANAKCIKAVEKLPGIKTTVKGDYGKIGRDFGNATPRIIAHFASASPEAILHDIELKGSYSLKAGNALLSIKQEHIIVERSVPEQYAEAPCRHCNAYLDKERTAELDAEGFARELMRRVQALRKKAGLKKNDQIEIFILADAESAGMLEPWKSQIMAKTGAKDIMLSAAGVNNYEHRSSEEIKDRKFEIGLEKA